MNDETSRILAADEAFALSEKFSLPRLAHKTELRFRTVGLPAVVELRPKTIGFLEDATRFEVEVNYRVGGRKTESGCFLLSARGTTLERAVADVSAALYSAIQSQIAATREALAIGASARALA